MEETKEISKPQPLIGPDITNNPTGKIFCFAHTDKTADVALFFPYVDDMVMPTTVNFAFNEAGVRMNRYGMKFMPETPETQGKKRLDSQRARERFPKWVAMAEQRGLELKNYIWVNIYEASRYGKQGELPPEKQQGSRADRRKKAVKKRGNNRTRKKKKRKK